MPIFKRLVTATLFSAIAATTGCASREYVTRTVLRDIHQSDPKIRKLRVYPNVSFVTVYERTLGEAVDVSGSAGTVETGKRGQRVIVSVGRKLPGAVVKLERFENQPVLWVSFDERCADVDCSFGFIRTSDGLFRLFRVPPISGYDDVTVYRKRVAPRRRMEKTKIFATSDATATYFTVRGHALSVGLEVKEREDVQIDVVNSKKEGVRPGR